MRFAPGRSASSLRSVILTAVIAVGSAALGLAVAARPAAASTLRAGWTCYQTDLCHAGSQPCCDDWTFDHCTTEPSGCGQS